jgi:hypothetical protein
MCGAFTSDAESRWAEPWISNWPSGFSRFWAQVARHLMRRQDIDGFEIQIARQGRKAAVTLDAVDLLGEYQNDAETDLTVFHPQQNFPTRPVPQSAPGRYATEFDASMGGDYWLRLTQQSRGRIIMQQTRGFAVGYPDELRLRPADEPLLRELAADSGGRFRPEPEAVFAPSPTAMPRNEVLWPYLATLAAIACLIDVALRRVDLGPIVARFKSILIARTPP